MRAPSQARPRCQRCRRRRRPPRQRGGVHHGPPVRERRVRRRRLRPVLRVCVQPDGRGLRGHVVQHHRRLRLPGQRQLLRRVVQRGHDHGPGLRRRGDVQRAWDDVRLPWEPRVRERDGLPRGLRHERRGGGRELSLRVLLRRRRLRSMPTVGLPRVALRAPEPVPGQRLHERHLRSVHRWGEGRERDRPRLRRFDVRALRQRTSVLHRPGLPERQLRRQRVRGRERADARRGRVGLLWRGAAPVHLGERDVVERRCARGAHRQRHRHGVRRRRGRARRGGGDALRERLEPRRPFERRARVHDLEPRRVRAVGLRRRRVHHAASAGHLRRRGERVRHLPGARFPTSTTRASPPRA